MGLVAGVDSSTQSCTVEIYDSTTGAARGTGRASHPPTFPPESEQHPTTWWEAFTIAFAAACESASVAPSEIDAIGVAGQGHGLVLLDESGTPLRAAKLWNDTTSAAQSARMLQELGGHGWALEVGSVPTAAFTLSKVMWVAENEPNVLDGASLMLVPADYLVYRLTGRAVTDRSNASGTAYFSAHEMRWRPDLLKRFVGPVKDWPTMLPEVLGPQEPAGTVTAEASHTLGLRPDVVVGPGMGDQHAGFIGLGLQAGDVLFSIGTSGVVMTACDHPVHDPSGWVDGVADGVGGYLPLVSTLNSTKVTDTFTRLLGVDHEEMARLAITATASPDRPVLAAYLDGERTPNRPEATGILAGLTNESTREDIARAAYEGVLLGLLEGLEAIRTCGVDVGKRVAVTGGGAKSPAYRQLLADLMHEPVVRFVADESVARGAAIQAAAVLAESEIAVVRDDWAPAVHDVTTPRGGYPEDVTPRYHVLSQWTGLDAPR